MNTKSIIIGLGLTAFLGFYFLKDEVIKLTTEFTNIKILPVGFKNLNGKWNDGKPYVSFNLDLRFYNPTSKDFSADGVVVTIKRLLFYDQNNRFIGGSNINLSSLKVLANSSVLIPNVPIVLDAQTTLVNIINMINGNTFNTKNIKMSAIVDVLGAEYKI